MWYIRLIHEIERASVAEFMEALCFSSKACCRQYNYSISGWTIMGDLNFEKFSLKRKI